jgi:hypothetical protein
MPIFGSRHPERARSVVNGRVISKLNDVDRVLVRRAEDDRHERWRKQRGDRGDGGSGSEEAEAMSQGVREVWVSRTKKG